MKDQELLGHLADLARRLGFDVRTDQGPFRDGSCRLLTDETVEAKRRIIVLNRASPTYKKIAALTRVLSECPLDDIYLLPAVRNAIEKYRSQPERTDSIDEDEDSSEYTDSQAQPSSIQEAPCPNPPLNP